MLQETLPLAPPLQKQVGELAKRKRALRVDFQALPDELDFCKRHHLPVSRELGSAIASAVRVAAATYSVAAIWNAIWKVVRDAAAPSRTEFYNLPRAAQTLPGKMKRLLEKVRKRDATLKPWDRPPLRPETGRPCSPPVRWATSFTRCSASTSKPRGRKRCQSWRLRSRPRRPVLITGPSAFTPMRCSTPPRDTT